MNDDEAAEAAEAADDDENGRGWPVKGPATAQQAILAIGFVFFLGVAIGFLLARTF